MESEAQLRYRREKAWAIGVFRSAVRSGHLKRPPTCESCGEKCAPSGHHEDYSKPREVKWLCCACHFTLHQAERLGFDLEESKLEVDKATKKRINVALDPDLHCRVKKEAKKVRRTVQQAVRDLIVRGLGLKGGAK